jgi:hypothetical protein
VSARARTLRASAKSAFVERHAARVVTLEVDAALRPPLATRGTTGGEALEVRRVRAARRLGCRYRDIRRTRRCIRRRIVATRKAGRYLEPRARAAGHGSERRNPHEHENRSAHRGVMAASTEVRHAAARRAVAGAVIPRPRRQRGGARQGRGASGSGRADRTRPGSTDAGSKMVTGYRRCVAVEPTVKAGSSSASRSASRSCSSRSASEPARSKRCGELLKEIPKDAGPGRGKKKEEDSTLFSPRHARKPRAPPASLATRRRRRLRMMGTCPIMLEEV